MTPQNVQVPTIAPQTIDEQAIQTWLITYLAKAVNLDQSRIDITIPFDRYGLDSATAVGMTGELSTWLKSEQPPTLLYDYPTIAVLSKHLAGT